MVRSLATAANQIAGLDVGLDLETRRFDPTVAGTLLGGVFGKCDIHELGDTLHVGDPAVLYDDIASWPPESIGLTAGPLWQHILTATSDLITAHFASHQTFPISSRVVILRCQEQPVGRPTQPATRSRRASRGFRLR